MAKTPRLNYADASNPGLLSAGAQVVAGAKTYTNSATFSDYVYKSNQPIISGQIGTAVDHPNSPQKLPFNEFWVSRGITYDSVNRRFYVPVAGVYRITMNPFFRSTIAASRVFIGINNDAPTASTHRGHAYRESPTFDTGCIISVVSLSANDYVVFYLSDGSLHNVSSDRFNQFSIELIG